MIVTYMTKSLRAVKISIIEHIYECLRTVDTCLGCPWMGATSFTSGDAIMFGLSPFKDYITIYKDKNNIVVSGTELSHIVRNAYT